MGLGDKIYDLHLSMAFGTFKRINLQYLIDALPPYPGRYLMGLYAGIQYIYIFRLFTRSYKFHMPYFTYVLATQRQKR